MAVFFCWAVMFEHPVSAAMVRIVAAIIFHRLITISSCLRFNIWGNAVSPTFFEPILTKLKLLIRWNLLPIVLLAKGHKDHRFLAISREENWQWLRLIAQSIANNGTEYGTRRSGNSPATAMPNLISDDATGDRPYDRGYSVAILV